MNLRGWYTLLYKELLRFYKVALQTVAAPVITALLYLLVFAQVLASRTEVLPGVTYGQFLIPGLMMMSLIQNAFANTSSSIIQSKVTGNLIFILLTPLSPAEFLSAFVAAAVVRGMAVALGVYVVALLFLHLPVAYPPLALLFALIAGATLGSLGVIAGIWAEKFDQMAGFQNFIIVPLSFLSGVFYSVGHLPPLWRRLSHFNPFFYMIDGFRYSFFGVSDASPWLSVAVSLGSLVVVDTIAFVMIARGYKLRH
ncbi:MAG TPA: ABC transporter permease [Acidiferrobacteraceae bacterium]|nr:ABC transporter permease [Acidiferrobacteraceae bacterium]